LRPGEESLSVNWIEYFGEDKSSSAIKSVQSFRESIKVGPNSAFGVAKVAKIKECGRSVAGIKIRIAYEPSSNNPAHSSVRRLPRDDSALLDALATDAFSEIILNSQI